MERRCAATLQVFDLIVEYLSCGHGKEGWGTNCKSPSTEDLLMLATAWGTEVRMFHPLPSWGSKSISDMPSYL